MINRFNIRKIAVIELVLLYVIALGIDYFYFGGTRFQNIQPHPFWIPVLLMAAQYGIREGLLAATVASLLLALGPMPSPSLLADKYAYYFSLSLQPMLWIMGSLVVGAIRSRHINERDQLALQLKQATSEQQALHSTYQQLAESKKILDCRIASQLHTASMAFHAARNLYRVDNCKILAHLNELVKTILSPNKFSIFLLKQSQLVKTTQHGWTHDDNYCKQFTAPNYLFEHIIGQQKILCVSHPHDQQILAGEGVLAGPLYSVDTEQLVGMLKIEELGFLDFNVNVLESFRSLCEWIGTTLVDTQIDGTLPTQQPQSTIRDLAELKFQSYFLYQLSQRIDFEVSVIIIQLLHLNKLDSEKLAAITLAMSRALFELRDTDTVFNYGDTQDIYILLLPHTPLKHAELVVKKFEPKFRHLLPTQLKDVPLRATTEKLSKRIYQS